MTIYKNSGLAMAMQSAVGAAKTLTAISLAAPGVFTGTHDFSVGDFVLIECEGMIEVNNSVFQVKSVNTTVDFQVEAPDGSTGLDTTLFHAFTSGTAKKITFGTTVSGVQEFSASGGEPKYVPTTTVQDLSDKEEIIGSTAKKYALTMQWDPANAGQIAMKAAFLADTPKAFKVTWPSGRYVTFYGSVACSGMPSGSSQGVTTTPAAIAIKGDVIAGL